MYNSGLENERRYGAGGGAVNRWAALGGRLYCENYYVLYPASGTEAVPGVQQRSRHYNGGGQHGRPHDNEAAAVWRSR